MSRPAARLSRVGACSSQSSSDRGSCQTTLTTANEAGDGHTGLLLKHLPIHSTSARLRQETGTSQQRLFLRHFIESTELPSSGETFPSLKCKVSSGAYISCHHYVYIIDCLHIGKCSIIKGTDSCQNRNVNV